MIKKEYIRLIYIRTRFNPLVWEQVYEVNLGTILKPNSEILEVKYTKIEKEEYERLKRIGFLK